MSTPDWRRLLPPPRRRPGLATVIVWWRVEVLLVLAVGGAWHYAGGRVVELLAGAAMLVSASTASGRVAAVRFWQLLAVPHRVRAAFVQGGVMSQHGRLPWIYFARPVGDAVLVSVGLRSGVAVGDLRDAVPVILVACGASQVDVVSPPGRPDRATVVVVRPRRGLW